MQQLNVEEISGACTRSGHTGVDLVTIVGKNIHLAWRSDISCYDMPSPTGARERRE
jgi:hypothetical protein